MRCYAMGLMDGIENVNALQPRFSQTLMFGLRTPLVLLQPYNAVSVAAGPSLARRVPPAMVGPWSRDTTPPGAGLRPPEGRVHKRASALLPSLDVCPIRRRAGVAHLHACERADTAL